MFVEHNIFVGISHINSLRELTNTALLSYLEDMGLIHSEKVGYGISNIDESKKSWILLSWKIKVIKRPKFADNLRVKTWSREIQKIYAYRDFEVYNENDELIAIATSKWIYIDIEKGKIEKISEDVSKAYEVENISVFENTNFKKIQDPGNYLNKIDYKITKSMIDINKHLHNTYYMDLAKEVLPDEISFSNEINEFEVMYKNEIKLGDIVKVMYSKVDEFYYVVIKNEKENKIHAIIKLKCIY